MNYTVNSSHTEDLADGKTVEPGDTVSLSDKSSEEPHNQRLIDDGVLVPVSGSTQQEADSKLADKKPTTKKEGDK